MLLGRIIEAMIFAAEIPLTANDLVGFFEIENPNNVEVSLELIQHELDQLVTKFQSHDFSYELKRINSGYQFVTKTDYADYVRLVLIAKDKKKISKSALEALAVIAYKQPVTKAEIEYIRGVNSDYAVNKLLENQLIEISGRSDLPGKPLLYRTSPFFLEYFKINSISDLPTLAEIKVDEEVLAKEYKNILNKQNQQENKQ